MKKTENLLKILNVYSRFMKDLGIFKNNTNELDMLIKAIQSNENLEFKKLINTIEKIESTNSSKTKKNIYETGRILKKLYSGENLSNEEGKFIDKFNDKDIKLYLSMDEDDFVNVIVNNTNQIKSLDTLKLILYLKYDMEFKGNKSRKTIVNEACYLISQKKYYENMENAYKNQPKR